MGLWELLLIAFIVLVVAGPQRLPTIMRTLGYWMGRGKAIINGLQSELDREGESIRQSVDPESKREEDDRG